MSKPRLAAAIMCSLITVGVLAASSTPAFAAMPKSPQVVANAQTTEKLVSVRETSVTEKATGIWVQGTKFPSLYGSLSNISQTVYGSAGYWPGLCQTNKLPNCNVIQVGQSIYVPNTPPTTPAPIKTTTTTTKPANTSKPANTATPTGNRSKAQQVVDYALAQVGKPYVWAAAGPNAFDCSGLVVAAFSRVGISLPHQDAQMLYSGKGYAVSKANLQPGDVVWPYIGHVFIYIGNGKIVEAANPSQGVRTNTLYGFYAARRYV